MERAAEVHRMEGAEGGVEKTGAKDGGLKGHIGEIF
jgi:hypothetical protein